jgi:uncharacterized membrane protein YfcA
MIAVPALLGAWIGAQIAIDLDDRLFNRILAIVMLLVMVYLVIPRRTDDGDQTAKPGRALLTERLVSIIVFFFLGMYGGFIQAGIGFLILAALTWIKNYDLVTANAIKVFVVFFYTIVALGAFIIASKIHWQIGLTLAVGNSAGGWLGGQFAVLKGAKAIRWILIFAILSFSIRLFLM